MKVALWTAGYGALSDSVIVPLLSAILEEFSDASETMRNLFVSGASAVMAMIFAMLTGVLMRHFSKRKLLILGTTLFAIGGIGGAFAHSMEFLLLTRMLDGMSDGIIMTTAASLVAQLFPDEKERSSFFSYNTVFSALFGMATASIAGVHFYNLAKHFFSFLKILMLLYPVVNFFFTEFLISSSLGLLIVLSNVISNFVSLSKLLQWHPCLKKCYHYFVCL